MIYLAIWLLTIFDAIATCVGVTMFGLEEGNPLMLAMFGWSVSGTCILAVVLTGAALLLVRRYGHQYRWIGYAVTGVLVLKIIVAVMHVVWMMVALGV